MTVAAAMPPMTAVPMTFRAMAPEPGARARGIHPHVIMTDNLEVLT